MKTTISIILALALVLACLAGCDMNNELPTDPAPTEPTLPQDPTMEALETYIRFIEMTKSGFPEATRKYVHYEIEDHYIRSQLSTDKTRTYEIIRCEKLFDELWAVELFFTSDSIPLGGYTEHYVGIIDGEYWVMTSVRNIPAELTDGTTLEPYKPHGPGVVG